MASKFFDERKAYPLAFKKTMECETCLVYPILFLSFQKKQFKIQCVSCFLKLSPEDQNGFRLHVSKLPSVNAAVTRRVQFVLTPPPKTKLNRKYVAHSIVHLANSIFKRASSENQSVAVVLTDHRFLTSILDLSMVAHGFVDIDTGLKLLRYYEDTFTKEMLIPFRAPRNPQRTLLVGSNMASHSLLVKSKTNACHFLFGELAPKPDILLVGEFCSEVKDALFLLNSCVPLLKKELQKIHIYFTGYHIIVIPLSEKEAKPRYDWNQTSLDETYVSDQWIAKMTKEIECDQALLCRPVGNDLLNLLQPSPFGLYSFDGSVLEFAYDWTSESRLKPMEKIIPPVYRFVHAVLKQTLERYVSGEEKMGPILNSVTSAVFEMKEKKDNRLHFLMGFIQIQNIPMLKQKPAKEEKELKEAKEDKEFGCKHAELTEAQSLQSLKEYNEIKTKVKQEGIAPNVFMFILFFLVFITYLSFFGVLIDYYLVV